MVPSDYADIFYSVGKQSKGFEYISVPLFTRPKDIRVGGVCRQVSIMVGNRWQTGLKRLIRIL